MTGNGDIEYMFYVAKSVFLRPKVNIFNMYIEPIDFLKKDSNTKLKELAQIKTTWNANGYYESVDWMNLDEDHPARNFERVLQLISSNINDSTVRFSVPDSPYFATYEYFQFDDGIIGRKLIQMNPEPDYISESWALDIEKPIDLSSLSSMHYGVDRAGISQNNKNVSEAIKAEVKVEKVAPIISMAMLSKVSNQRANAELRKLNAALVAQLTKSIHSKEDIITAIAEFKMTLDHNLMEAMAKFAVNNMTYAEIKQFISQDLTEDEQVYFFGALGKFQQPETESILVELFNDTEVSSDNAYRSMFALGELNVPTQLAVSALKDMSLNFKHQEPAVNFNSLIVLGRIYEKVTEGQRTEIKAALEDYNNKDIKGFFNKDEIYYLAMKATGQPEYLEPTLQDLNKTGDDALKPNVRLAAASLVGAQALAGNTLAAEAVKKLIVTEQNPEVMSKLAIAYKFQSLPEDLRNELIERADSTDDESIKNSILIELAQTPERCENNQAYLSSQLGKVNNELQSILQTFCSNI
ncbi:hypothetical protein [Veronia nyctiphanis]|nr:hypothetical protein [Veronia nyctiphanis]